MLINIGKFLNAELNPRIGYKFRDIQSDFTPEGTNYWKYSCLSLSDMSFTEEYRPDLKPRKRCRAHRYQTIDFPRGGDLFVNQMYRYSND